MKRRPIIRAASLVLLGLGVFVFTDGCARRLRTKSAPVAGSVQPANTSVSDSNHPRININSASADELASLPGIGPALAARIVEHREKYGPFRRPEHLLMVPGISDKRYRQFRDMIVVE